MSVRAESEQNVVFLSVALRCMVGIFSVKCSRNHSPDLRGMPTTLLLA